MQTINLLDVKLLIYLLFSNKPTQYRASNRWNENIKTYFGLPCEYTLPCSIPECITEGINTSTFI
jgi:hypothetical protein